MSNTDKAVAELMKAADGYAHVYAFVGDDTMPRRRKELESAIRAAIAQPDKVQPNAGDIKEWASKDFSILIHYLREKTYFDADLIERMLNFAQTAIAQPASQTVEPLNMQQELRDRLEDYTFWCKLEDYQQDIVLALASGTFNAIAARLSAQAEHEATYDSLINSVKKQPVAQPVQPTIGGEVHTDMTVEEANAYAWSETKKAVGTAGWTVSDHCTHQGFFNHGWNDRGQFEKQRRIAATSDKPVAQAEPAQLPPDATKSDWNAACQAAYITLRKHEHTIPSHWLEAMRDIGIAASTEPAQSVDALRYRWLRSNANNGLKTPDLIIQLSIEEHWLDPQDHLEATDKAIDAAIASQKATQ